MKRSSRQSEKNNDRNKSKGRIKPKEKKTQDWGLMEEFPAANYWWSCGKEPSDEELRRSIQKYPNINLEQFDNLMAELNSWT